MTPVRHRPDSNVCHHCPGVVDLTTFAILGCHFDLIIDNTCVHSMYPINHANGFVLICFVMVIAIVDTYHRFRRKCGPAKKWTTFVGLGLTNCIPRKRTVGGYILYFTEAQTHELYYLLHIALCKPLFLCNTAFPNKLVDWRQIVWWRHNKEGNLLDFMGILMVCVVKVIVIGL